MRWNGEVYPKDLDRGRRSGDVHVSPVNPVESISDISRSKGMAFLAAWSPSPGNRLRFASFTCFLRLLHCATRPTFFAHRREGSKESIQQGKCYFYRSLISRFWDSFLSSKWCNFKNKGWINPDIFIFKIVKLLYSLWLLLLLLFLSIEIIVKGEFEYSSLHF